MYCHHCSTELNPDAFYCSTCGMPQSGTDATRRLSLSQAQAAAMPQGICPYCGSDEVYADKRGLMAWRGGWLYLNLHDLLRGRKIETATFLCSRCGAIQVYMADYDDARLEQLKQTWHRVPRSV